MKALIIGGSGFVGGFLINHLVDDLGYEVSITKTAKENLVNDKVTIYTMDVLDREQIKYVIETVKPDYIFHLAAQASVGLSWKNPNFTIDVNIKGSINVLDMIREIDFAPRILLIGSGEEYGHIRMGESPIHEDTIPRPGNIYAATKVCQNMIGSIYADAYKMDIMMVRAFNHIGPNQAPLFVVSDFSKQIAEIERGEKEPVIYVGNLTAQRDFTDVRDVVKAYALLASLGKRGQTYNVGSGKAVEIQQILDKLLAMAKCPIKIMQDKAKLRPVDVPIIEADITKLTQCTGWNAQIDIDRTLEETLEFWRKKGITT